MATTLMRTFRRSVVGYRGSAPLEADLMGGHIASQVQIRAMLKNFKAQWQPVIQQSGLKFD